MTTHKELLRATYMPLTRDMVTEEALAFGDELRHVVVTYEAGHGTRKNRRGQRTLDRLMVAAGAFAGDVLIAHHASAGRWGYRETDNNAFTGLPISRSDFGAVRVALVGAGWIEERPRWHVSGIGFDGKPSIVASYKPPLESAGASARLCSTARSPCRA